MPKFRIGENIDIVFPEKLKKRTLIMYRTVKGKLDRKMRCWRPEIEKVQLWPMKNCLKRNIKQLSKYIMLTKHVMKK